MPVHVRIELPDRPGALASVARTVAAGGGNIRTVNVLHAEQGRAVDELLVEWPRQRDTQILSDALARCPGVAVLGLRRVPRSTDTHEVDVVLQLVQQPARAFRTLIDALPSLLLADWAALVGSPDEAGAAIHTSVRAPRPLPPVHGGPSRAHRRVLGDTCLVVIPGEVTTVVAREAAPPFLQAEVERVLTLVAVASKINSGDPAGVPADGTPSDGTGLTGRRDAGTYPGAFPVGPDLRGSAGVPSHG